MVVDELMGRVISTCHCMCWDILTAVNQEISKEVSQNLLRKHFFLQRIIIIYRLEHHSSRGTHRMSKFMRCYSVLVLTV